MASFIMKQMMGSQLDKVKGNINIILYFASNIDYNCLNKYKYLSIFCILKFLVESPTGNKKYDK